MINIEAKNSKKVRQRIRSVASNEYGKLLLYIKHYTLTFLLRTETFRLPTQHWTSIRFGLELR